MIERNKDNRILLVLDIISLCTALYISIFLRFHKDPGLNVLFLAYNGLYYLIFGLVITIYIAVFYFNAYGEKPLFKQNPYEKIAAVLKNQFLVFICLIALLYIIKVGFWASRAVILMTVFFSTVFDIVIHFLYGSYLQRKEEIKRKPRRFLLITDDTSENATDLLKGMLYEKDDIIRVVTPEEYSKCSAEIEKTTKYDEIAVYLHSENVEKLYHGFFTDPDRPVNYILNTGGIPSSAEMISSTEHLSSIYHSGLKEKCPVLGVGFTVTNLSEAVQYVRDNARNLKGKYICFGNVHTTVTAYENEKYMEVQNGACFIFPDGVPIHREQLNKGHRRACRVAGPDFMRLMFLSAMDGKTSMYFYGSTPETIEGIKQNLEKNYNGIDVRGYESPPFRELSPEEDNEVIERINASGADILWVGLGAPKQESWMYAHKDRINALMLGVGAGFDFHAGTVRRAPLWIQKMGMEWLYRLLQDPKKLLFRYLVTNFKFVLYRVFDSERSICHSERSSCHSEQSICHSERSEES